MQADGDSSPRTGQNASKSRRYRRVVDRPRSQCALHNNHLLRTEARAGQLPSQWSNKAGGHLKRTPSRRGADNNDNDNDNGDGNGGLRENQEGYPDALPLPDRALSLSMICRASRENTHWYPDSPRIPGMMLPLPTLSKSVPVQKLSNALEAI